MTNPEPNWLSAAITTGQRVWTIPPAISFLDALADGLLAETGGDPLELAEITVLLPTRRAGRSLREAFLRRADGAPMLLPRLMPLQDIDEDEALLSGFAGDDSAPLDIPPAISPLSRQILLTRLIIAQPGPDGRHPSPDQAARLAQELARFLDQVQTERLSFSTLEDLVPDSLAKHWQTTLAFLQVVTQHWPHILDERGTVDPADHRNLVFAAQADAWRSAPPRGLIIAAGSTGSVPATRDLLGVVAKLPNGCVVLPGLDQDLDTAGWDAVEESHPQFMLKILLAALDTRRSAVHAWPADPLSTSGSQRQHLISEIMRPADTSERWRSLETLTPEALDGMQRIEALTPREEAASIALVMRWVAEDQGRTGALVTPDRDLARRVSAELERWDLTVDDSAGRPLAMTPPGVFLILTAAMIAEECAPIPVLSALKHPLAASGQDPPAFRDCVRDLERSILRGPRPPQGMEGLAKALVADSDYDPDLLTFLNSIAAIVEPFSSMMEEAKVSLTALLTAHVQMAEHLAASNDTAGPLRLWAGEDGEAVARFVADLADAAEALGDIEPWSYTGLLDALLDAAPSSRPPYGSHPRLSILGPLEARLLQPDVLILAGLNEGTWPADAAADPWMSRPMRKAFGLPTPEQRIGQAAHDVAQAMAAPEVILTRSLRVDGTPTVPSRWWRRLDQVLESADIPIHTETGRFAWLPWAASLTRPATVDSVSAPAPKPPVAVRPRRLSVTEIETWMRDPYEIYARHVLKLRALDPIDADASAAEYGIIVHDILQTFVEMHPGKMPGNAGGVLNDIAQSRFEKTDLPPGVQAFWQPRFEQIGAWFIDMERKRREELQTVHAEVRGEITLQGPEGPFTLVAKADRIEAKSDGTLAIIDYKTGSVPKIKEIAAGFAPQLPLEAVIAAEGGFKGLDAKAVSELLYWRLTGRGDGGETTDAAKDTDGLRAEALDGLMRLIAAFDDPNTAYTARPHPDMAPAYGDTQHLARVKEWATAEGRDG